MKLIVFALMGLAAFGRVEKIRTHTDQEYWKAWNGFLAIEEANDRHRGYATKQEHDIRFEIFKDAMETIKAHNKGHRSWEMGINQFADLTRSEFKAHTSCMQMKKTKGTKVFKAPADWNRTSPSAVDWVAEGSVTPVENQGSCGSCWAFSTTGAIESRSNIAGGALISLSEQDLVDCSKANSGCGGGLMDYAFSFVETNGGLCSEDDYAYTAVDGTCVDSSCTKYDPVSSFTDVAKSTASLEAACAAGPVSIAIEADETAFQYYSSGVLDGTCGTGLDHGVLLVGYGTDTSGDYSTDYWKVKNSWGSNWGESGYIRLCRNCDKNDGAGQCGLLEMASYPVV